MPFPPAGKGKFSFLNSCTARDWNNTFPNLPDHNGSGWMGSAPKWLPFAPNSTTAGNNLSLEDN